MTAVLGVALVAGCSTPIGHRPAKDGSDPRPIVRVDVSSAEALLLHPERVLDDVRGFWDEDRAYWLVAKHAAEVGVSVPPAGWEEAVRRLASVPLAERRTDGRYLLAQELAGAQRTIDEVAVPHIASFFAPERVDLSTTVFGTVATWQNAFQKHYRIVVNLSHPDWRRDLGTTLNALVHEVFHVGFYRAECLMSELQLDDSERYDILLNLLNEGLATWVAYAARPDFPSQITDYAMLDDRAAVREALGRLNGLLAAEETTPAEAFRRQMWQIGVQQRAFYVGGAHMARTIEQARGRAALATALLAGPRSFVAAYNRVAGDGDRIVEYPEPTALSPFQDLRRSAVAGDYRAVRRALAAIRAFHARGGQSVGHALQTTGQLLLNRRKANLAVDVFSLYRDLFPRHANPLEGLVQAHVMRGDRTRAERACRDLLALVPSNILALETLAALRATPGRTP